MQNTYYSLFINNKDKKPIKKIPVDKEEIEKIFEAYEKCTNQDIVMCLGWGKKSIYEDSETAKIKFRKGDYNSFKIILNDENLGIINKEKDKERIFNRCAQIWNLPLPFP